MDTGTTGSLFVPAGASWLPTDLARGPWSVDALHGGPVAALVARAVEQLAGELGAHRARTAARVIAGDEHAGAPERSAHTDHLPDTMMATRLTVELIRPVPVAPLTVTAAVTRPGRKVQLVEARVTAAGRDVVWARAVLLRRHGDPHWPGAQGTASNDRSGDVRDPRTNPPSSHTPRASTTEDDQLPTGGPAIFKMPVGPEQAERQLGLTDAYPAFHNVGAELRFVDGTFDTLGPSTVWIRLRAPVVPGELPSPLQRAAAAADFGNGVSAVLPFEQWRFINPDLTVVLHRPPIGQWVGLQARTDLGVPGVGVATSVLWDTQGTIGSATQTLVVEHRP